MADQQQQPINNPAASVLNNLPGNNNKYDLEQSLNIIANALQTNPNALNSLGLGRRAPTESQSNYSENKWKFDSERGHSQRKSKSTGSILGDFEEGIKQELLDSLAGGSFKKGIQGALDTFAKEFGLDIRDLPAEAGKQLTKQAVGALKNSKVGQDLWKGAKGLGNDALNSLFNNVSDKGAAEAAKAGLKNVAKSFLSGGEGAGGLAAEGLGGLASSGGAAGASALASSGAALMSAIGPALMAAGPYLIVIVAALKILGPALEGVASVAKALGAAANREEEQRKKMLENAKKRQEADIKYLAEQPFKILEQAAQKWYDTWDANLSKIGQTQGYDKEAVYALYEGYADRLRSEGYGSVISATDVIDKLSTVLDSGLSGKAAEEFAYAATKLNAAIPNQDFFSYVDTYASIAANAIAQGKTESQALSEANQQLEAFASNLLYSSRELAGGFSTGLKNSADLFNNAVKIAQTAKTYNASEISGTLTSVSAVIGAIAPDLASSLVDNVVQAAIGGNDSSLVALRSLAGVNAGNTEFLRALAENPKEIFSTLFSNLASMQTMSPDNYMEVAEGLASVFGIDKNALARVDFNYLADAISAMNTNSNTLEENLSLLQSGQTTTSAEQLKAQEINSIILEEGLAYVIDSEAGRMIQQHMWDEQRDNAIMKNEYAVNLQGAALDFLEGIRETFRNLMIFLNPIGYAANAIANIAETVAEVADNQQDIQEVLELGAVGSNRTALSNLTTTNRDLQLTTSLVEMMGGRQGTRASSLMSWLGVTNPISAMNTGFDMMMDLSHSLVTGLTGLVEGTSGGSSGSAGVVSRYVWGTVGKSLSQAIKQTSMNTNTIASVAAVSATQAAQNSTNARFAEFLATAEAAVSGNNPLTYDQWVATAREHGISDYNAALEAYGRTESEIQNFFEKHEAQAGARKENERKEKEEAFWKDTRKFWDYDNGTSGKFQTAVWLPFFGEGQKYDTRMDSVDTALSTLQGQIGDSANHTVISGVEELSRKLGDDSQTTVISVLGLIHAEFNTTFVTSSSMFQKCLQSWVKYINDSKSYTDTLSKSAAWRDLTIAERDQQSNAALALANALGEFKAADLESMNPQLQTNVLLGQIVTILQTIAQQSGSGGLSLIDTMSALGLGLTTSNKNGSFVGGK